MAFTYNPAGDANEKIVAKIRRYTGDTRKGRGQRPAPVTEPDESNYSDEEILAFYTDEDSHEMKTAAAIYETLAVEWTNFAGTHKLGPESREYKASERYSEMAQALRRTYGHSQASNGLSTTLVLARTSDT